MAHAPEQVEQYVCLNCQVTYAGSVTSENGEHRFHAPDDCHVCNDAEFVKMESYLHRAAEQSA